ncbi:MAG: aldose 1-epimerase [Solirubrobacteraceae bacterium]|nr:aldose 1-epimerase [Solirubrobacteraceae bacterium]
MRATREGFQTLTIGAPDGELQATFVPAAGMVCCSLRHRGRELLAQRHGLRAYAERGATMGIPLLYPWANRLAAFDYPTARGPVELSRGDPLLQLDPNGLPIHGVRPGALAWEPLEGDDTGRSLRARLRWERSELLAIFPWRHEVELHASVRDATLTLHTTVRASDGSTDAEMPIAFGYHPYLTLPGGDRPEWEVELPFSRRLLLDARKIPTGASEPLDRRRFELDRRDLDDAFAEPTSPPVFAARAGGAGVELELLGGYRFGQLYAPVAERFVCFEPMTAPTNALRTREDLTLLAPGGAFGAAFAITVE